MKKVLLVLVIIIVILLAICLGGFLVFKDELDVLTEGLENGNIMNAVSKVIEVQEKQLVKIIAWYDDEMSYLAQMVRTAKYFGNK